jgi:hypothetical protein
VGKLLVATGLVLTVVGLLLISGWRVPLVSRLDLSHHGERRHFIFIFPLGTCLLISLLLTLLLWLLRRL